VPLRCDLAPSSARRYDVAGLGQNSIDLVARVPVFPLSNSKHHIDALAWIPGGQVASAMVGCARLGWRTCYIGRFGDDDLGARGRASLEDAGVDLAVTVVPGARSRFAIILVDAPTGNRTVLWDRDRALDFNAADVPVDVIASSRVLLVDCEDVEASIRAAEVARAHGVITVVDVEAVVPGVDDLLQRIDVIVASEGFPEALTREPDPVEALRMLDTRYRPALCCVTRGPAGSRALCAGDLIETPGFRVTCVDSTGAGDAFRSGFIAGLLRWGTEDVPRLLRHANAVAALSCRAAGARDGLPVLAEVDELLLVHA
jgi:sugar/nucleoside kinase (ribokinase family)